MNRPLVTLLLSAVLLAPAAGVAQTDPSASDIKQAAQAFDRGRQAFRAENYVEAAEHFEVADGHASNADTLRLAVLARKEAGQIERAMTLAALALTLYPEDEQTQETANAVIEAGNADHGRVDVTCSEPCELLLDRKLVHGVRVGARTLYVKPGEHSIQASWSEERVQDEAFTAEGGAAVSVDFVAPEITEPEPEEPVVAPVVEPTEDPVADDSSKGGWHPAVFWTGVALTAGGAGVSTWLGVKALNEPGQDAVREECGEITDPQECSSLQTGLENQRNANIAIGATAAVGAFTIITGIWLTDWGGKKAKKESATHRRPETAIFRSGDLTVRPLVSVGDGAMFGASGTF